MARGAPRDFKRQPHSCNGVSVHMSGGLDFSVILLAAGQSRRMGDVNKLLLPAADGAPMVQRAAALYLGLGMKITVVVGHQADRVSAALSGLDVKIIPNADYASGQQSSVRAGLGDIDTAGCKAVLVALSDQIFLTADDISQFCGAFLAGSRDKIMVPYWRETRGNPVLFPAKIIEQIRADDKMSSVRKFIDSNPERVVRYDAPSRHFIRDIDTPEDAQRFLPRPNQED